MMIIITYIIIYTGLTYVGGLSIRALCLNPKSSLALASSVGLAFTSKAERSG